MDLSRLLAPRSIAVIGGGVWARGVMTGARLAGFDGLIWPVHPTAASLGGVAAVRAVADLPEPPDAAFVAVNRVASVKVVAELAACRAGGAVIFAAGFAEAAAELPDGPALQDALVAAAGEMPFLGPNCYGFVNYLDRAALWPDQHGGKPVARGVAVIAQSSNIALNLTMQRRGLPLGCVVTLGNQAQQGLGRVGQALLADPRITALGLHIEGVGDLRGLEALAAAARRAGKPIIALKVGRTAQAAAGTVSHTGAMAGGAAGASALFARLGIVEVTGLDVLLEALKIAHVTGGLTSARVVSASCSGGEAGLMSDMGAAAGVVFPPLGAARAAALRSALGPRVALANPLDYNTYIWGDTAAMTATFSALSALDGTPDNAPDGALTCVVLDMPRADRCDPSAWEPTLVAIRAVAAQGHGPLAVLASLADTLPEAVAENLLAAGVVPLAGIDPALRAIASCQRPAGAIEAPVALPALLKSPRLLSEADAKTALAAHGLRVPRGGPAADAVQAVAVARDIGFPVVLKALGHAHKTEAGAVVLGVPDAGALEVALAGMSCGGSHGTYLVEEMIAGGVCEVLMGVTVDAAHGMVLTLGAGGTLAEVMADTVHLLLPTTAAAIDAALDGLAIAPVLAGYRGAPGADRAAIVRAVLAVQDYAIANHGRIAEIEINPLICTPAGAVAADALIRIGESDD